MRKAAPPAGQPDPVRRRPGRLKSLALAAILVAGALATPFWLGFIMWLCYELAGWLAD